MTTMAFPGPTTYFGTPLVLPLSCRRDPIAWMDQWCKLCPVAVGTFDKYSPASFQKLIKWCNEQPVFPEAEPYLGATGNWPMTVNEAMDVYFAAELSPPLKLQLKAAESPAPLPPYLVRPCATRKDTDDPLPRPRLERLTAEPVLTDMTFVSDIDHVNEILSFLATVKARAHPDAMNVNDQYHRVVVELAQFLRMARVLQRKEESAVSSVDDLDASLLEPLVVALGSASGHFQRTDDLARRRLTDRVLTTVFNLRAAVDKAKRESKEKLEEAKAEPGPEPEPEPEPDLETILFRRDLRKAVEKVARKPKLPLEGPRDPEAWLAHHYHQYRLKGEPRDGLTRKYIKHCCQFEGFPAHPPPAGTRGEWPMTGDELRAMLATLDDGGESMKHLFKNAMRMEGDGPKGPRGEFLNLGEVPPPGQGGDEPQSPKFKPRIRYVLESPRPVLQVKADAGSGDGAEAGAGAGDGEEAKSQSGLQSLEKMPIKLNRCGQRGIAAWLDQYRSYIKRINKSRPAYGVLPITRPEGFTLMDELQEMLDHCTKDPSYPAPTIKPGECINSKKTEYSTMTIVEGRAIARVLRKWRAANDELRHVDKRIAEAKEWLEHLKEKLQKLVDTPLPYTSATNRFRQRHARMSQEAQIANVQGNIKSAERELENLHSHRDAIARVELEIRSTVENDYDKIEITASDRRPFKPAATTSTVKLHWSWAGRKRGLR